MGLSAAPKPAPSPAAHAERVLENRELQRFPPDLNRGDSQKVKDERVFAH